MPMIRKAKRFAVVSATVARLAVPVVVLGGSLGTQACMGNKGPSNVSQGKLYSSGDPTFDAYFNDLYNTQVSLARAPDRAKAPREKLAAALSLAPTSTPEQIGAALDTRAAALAKSGTAAKLAVTGLDDGSTSPSATVSTNAAPAEQTDRTLVAVVGETASAEASLLGEMRRTRAAVEALRQRADALGPTIGSTHAFKVGGARKRGEVEKNLEDAKRLIPLMTARVDELEREATSMLKGMVQATRHEPPPPPPPPPPPEEPKKKKKGAGGAPAPTGTGAAPAPKPAAPASDFEP